MKTLWNKKLTISNVIMSRLPISIATPKRILMFLHKSRTRSDEAARSQDARLILMTEWLAMVPKERPLNSHSIMLRENKTGPGSEPRGRGANRAGRAQLCHLVPKVVTNGSGIFHLFTVYNLSNTKMYFKANIITCYFCWVDAMIKNMITQ